MTNEIVNAGNKTCWSLLSKEDSSYNLFEKFLDNIKRLDNLNSLVKWKNYCNQVVLAGENFFYKIYQSDIENGTFSSEVRKALGKIYREKFGIYWEVIEVKDRRNIYNIEIREKLKVCTPDNISFEEIFKEWGKTLKILENELNFKSISYQLSEQIDNLNEIKLIRDCVNKHIDYALTKNGDVVLLDDADWFISIIDSEGNWLSPLFNFYEIETNNGSKMFCPQKDMDKSSLGIKILSSTGEKINKWWIREISMENKVNINNFISIRENMLMDNIKFLSTDNKENKKLLVDNSQTMELLSIAKK